MRLTRYIVLHLLCAIGSPLFSADHWAFQSPGEPSIPILENKAWAKNPIDAFILRKLSTRNLVPSPQVGRARLLRRAHLDIIGLPPTPGQTREFLADERPDAYERTLDKLLASPRHGERWGRHWLDLARYADSSGFHDDLHRPNAWRYRDYVIQSLNTDKPYARFLTEQIAGDEAYPGNIDALTGTGFCRNGPSNDNNVKAPQREQYRLDQLDDVLSTTVSVFLGLTIGCARCHDHKSEPISQEDYYRILAVFNTGGPREYLIGGATQKEGKKQKGPAVRSFQDFAAKARPTFVLFRGDAKSRGPGVMPSVPSALQAIPFPKPEPLAGLKTTGLRHSLARWMTSGKHPLTWRVIVNRLWLHHLGRGIVESPSNFGTSGSPPSHPKLLDHLAQQLLGHGGQLKPIHRYILTSATYRQDSGSGTKAALGEDEMKLFGRFTPRRLEAEIIRDSILQASGNLNLQMGGPGIKPRIAPSILRRSKRNEWPLVKKETGAHWRRSSYIYVKRQLLMPMLELFDAPTATVSCELRARSTVPTQALTLLNNPFVNNQASSLASQEEDSTTILLEKTLGRTANPQLLAEADSFINERSKVYTDKGHSPNKARQMARTDLCVVLFNSSMFVYID
jgi:hypothetical protein